MRKNNAQSLKIPSASWIREVIKEEVKTQLNEQKEEKRATQGGFMNAPMKDFMGGPMDGSGSWNEVWDGPSHRAEKKDSQDAGENEESRMWNFWNGNMLADPIMEEPRSKSNESDKELEASISPVDEKSKARKVISKK